MYRLSAVVLILTSVLFLSCAAEPDAPPERPEWAIAIHGGAGTMDPEKYADRAPDYANSLRRALDIGVGILKSGGASLDAVEQVVSALENDPLFNAGRGAVLNWEGQVEMDASIMLGNDHSCGAVAGVRTIRNPISLARLVMEKSDHVLFAGPGAEFFADLMSIPREDPSYFHTEHRYESWSEFRAKQADPDSHGTVGCVALDREGRLAAGTSTGGMTGKQLGRVGDTPIIGAGTWADDSTCAVSCTGTGEEFIRHGVAQRVSDLMMYRQSSLHDAVDHVINNVLEPGDGGLIAVGHDGEISMLYSTEGMFRGAATSTGRYEVAIWDLPEENHEGS